MNIGAKLCEALGVNGAKVTSIFLSCTAPGDVAEVVITIQEFDGDKLSEVIRRMKLTEEHADANSQAR